MILSHADLNVNSCRLTKDFMIRVENKVTIGTSSESSSVVCSGSMDLGLRVIQVGVLVLLLISHD